MSAATAQEAGPARQHALHGHLRLSRPLLAQQPCAQGFAAGPGRGGQPSARADPGSSGSEGHGEDAGNGAGLRAVVTLRRAAADRAYPGKRKQPPWHLQRDGGPRPSEGQAFGFSTV
eukprot:COSAG06_NODE_31619_length_518_cov_1.112172_1_plen_116_part_10